MLKHISHDNQHIKDSCSCSSSIGVRVKVETTHSGQNDRSRPSSADLLEPTSQVSNVVTSRSVLREPPATYYSTRTSTFISFII